MTRLWGGLLALALALPLAACATPQRSPEIVVTTNILGDVVRELIGDALPVRVLMPAGADPHSFGISAHEADLLQGATLVIANGLGLEEGVLRHVDAAEDSGVDVLRVAELLDPIPVGEEGEPDPHFWTDPYRMLSALDRIEEAVRVHVPDLDPAPARAYRERVSALAESARERFAAIPAENRQLVTNHHVFGYLAERYRITVVGAVIPGGSTLAAPSARDLESLAGAITASGVHTIFVDSSQPDRLARVLADRAGIDVQIRSLATESLTAPGGGAASYLEMMSGNIDALAQSFDPPDRVPDTVR